MEDITKDPDTTEEINQTIEGEILEEDIVIEQAEPLEAEITIEDAPATEETGGEVYLERLQRTLAEFDNYRKRTDKEKSAMYNMGLTDTVLTILPVLDNFERALMTVCADESYVKGMELIYKQMIDILDSIGVTQIEAKGQSFDTNIHNAVMHIEDDQYGENEVVLEMQKGYIYKDDKVIRHSMVQVAN